MSEQDEKALESVEWVKARAKAKPSIGIILGSGLGALAEHVSPRTSLPYSKIPNFPITTVSGHAGNLVFGLFGGSEVAAMQGRFHYYEGYTMKEVAFPVRVLAGLGVKTLIVTNAAGGVNEELAPGDFMVLTDHINLMGTNPLAGYEGPEEQGARFVDMTSAYDHTLSEAAVEAGRKRGLRVARGVLAAVHGPCYETPAEVRMLRLLGADAVSMSTVPEVILARRLGMRVVGVSLITNRAAGLSRKGPSHAEVIDTSMSAHEGFVGLVEDVVREAGATHI